MSVLRKICEYLGCNIGDIMDFYKEWRFLIGLKRGLVELYDHEYIMGRWKYVKINDTCVC